jgi:Trk-type K+ transport system membrane component
MTILQYEYHMMDWWFSIFGPFGWIFMIAGTVAYIGLSVLIAYYVHKDALRRGIKNSELWLLIGLILNLIGLITYLLVRNNYNQEAEFKSK